jgi:hypothetical protein
METTELSIIPDMQKPCRTARLKTHMNTRSSTNPPLPRLLYSRREASFLLSESLRSVDYKLASGQLQYIRQGGRVKITHAELLRQAAIDDNTPVVPRRQPQTAQVPAESQKAA